MRIQHGYEATCASLCVCILGNCFACDATCIVYYTLQAAKLLPIQTLSWKAGTARFPPTPLKSILNVLY
eukprot:1159398-Pelagomonas_calceolata.AAC.20